jgi:MFS family permease
VNRDLLLLALCQGLFLTNNVALIAVNGLVGMALAPRGWMATLPITGYVVGSALSTVLVARLQQRLGRRRSFQIGLLVAFATALLSALAVSQGSFALLMVATVCGGFYAANASLYRFAGTELVAPAARERAVSWVLAGGIVGAFAGPNLAQAARGWLDAPFAGTYLALAGVALLALPLVSMIRFPPAPPAPAAAPGEAVDAPHGPSPGAARAAAPTGRPLRELARQPLFAVAVAAAALGYGVMNLLMAATPLAMAACGLPFGDAAFVLEWHVLGMFLPGFFTGHLIRRFGALPVMGAGVLLNLGCVAVALSGVALQQFLVALFLLGVGWNFLYTGGTTLLLQAYRPEEKARAQGAMDFCVFSTMALTSFASGALVTTQGWQWLNLGSLLPIAAVGAALAWLALRQRRGATAAA